MMVASPRLVIILTTDEVRFAQVEMNPVSGARHPGLADFASVAMRGGVFDDRHQEDCLVAHLHG